MSLRVRSLEAILLRHNDDILDSILRADEFAQSVFRKEDFQGIKSEAQSNKVESNPSTSSRTEAALDKAASDTQQMAANSYSLLDTAMINTYPTRRMMLEHLFPERYEFGSSESSSSQLGHRTRFASNSSNVRAKSILNDLFASAKFGFNPLTIFAVTMIPHLLLYLKLPLVYYVPISGAIFCYLQGLKVRYCYSDDLY